MGNLPVENCAADVFAEGCILLKFRGWRAFDAADVLSTFYFPMRCFIAMFLGFLKLARATLRTQILHDKREWLESLATSAQRAACDGDFRYVFSVVKKLSGFSVRPSKVVRLKSGELVNDKADIDKRWAEHFAEVACGFLCSNPDELRTTPVRPLAAPEYPGLF